MALARTQFKELAKEYLGQDAQTLASQLHSGVTIALNNPSGGTVSSFVVPNG